MPAVATHDAARTEATQLALNAIHDFLPCPTPEAWISAALEQQDLLLIDHANCEKKAASTALNLLYRYTDDFDLLNKMSRLAREEMLHFERVIAIMQQRGIAYRSISASRYAARLHQDIRRGEPERRIDTLIVGALIEARSCERFARLVLIELCTVGLVAVAFSLQLALQTGTVVTCAVGTIIEQADQHTNTFEKPDG